MKSTSKNCPNCPNCPIESDFDLELPWFSWDTSFLAMCPELSRLSHDVSTVLVLGNKKARDFVVPWLFNQCVMIFPLVSISVGHSPTV